MLRSNTTRRTHLGGGGVLRRYGLSDSDSQKRLLWGRSVYLEEDATSTSEEDATSTSGFYENLLDPLR